MSKQSGSSRVSGFALGLFLGVFGLGVVFSKAHRRNKALAAAQAA